MDSSAEVFLFLIFISVHLGVCNITPLDHCSVKSLEPPYLCTICDLKICKTFNATENFSIFDTVVYHYDMERLPPKIVDTFPKLSFLYASHCKIKSIQRSDFTALKDLSTVHLNYNNIEHLHADVFVDLKYLEEVHISGNPIKVLPPKLFAKNPNLGYFELNDGHIEELPEGFFKNNPNLSVIRMMNGTLKSIKVDFTKFPDITAIDFDNNTCVSISTEESRVKDVQKMLNENC
jgi:Leucine-rich repeat (LRR) protein